MRRHVVEIMINTIEKVAEDTGLSEDEYMLALAFSMAALLEHKGKNLMEVSVDEYTLAVGLRKNDAEDNSSHQETHDGSFSVH